MPLRGRKLTTDEALALCRKVGFTRERLITAVCVMKAESGGFVEAYNINVKLGADGEVVSKSEDRGLFQINSLHDDRPSTSPERMFSAIPNAKFAFKLSSSGTDFTPWFAFVNRKHEQFEPEVRAAFEADTWRELLPTIVAELERP